MRRAAALYVAGLGLFVVSFIWSWAALPPVVASHFDSNGNANGWMGHNSFLVFIAGMGLLGLVVVPGLGALAARHPGRYINVPNRRYWLRPENQVRFRSMFTALTMGIGAAIALLIGAANLATIYANTKQPANMVPPGGFVVGICVAVAVGLVLIIRGFRRSE